MLTLLLREKRRRLRGTSRRLYLTEERGKRSDDDGKEHSNMKTHLASVANGPEDSRRAVKGAERI